VRVGVEVGGTFTDLVAVDGGRITIGKVPSVPRQPDEGAFNALIASKLPLERVEDLVHGSTVATNAVLERKGARIALVLTQGFRDLLLIQRHDRRQVYELAYAKPTPLVARRDTFEVAERTLADGSAEQAVDLAQVDTLCAGALAKGGYQAVCICLLNAWANPAHEHEVAARIRSRLPDMLVTCSADIAREFREYERASTAVLSTYVQPVVEGYLRRFDGRLRRSGFKGGFSVMQSNGGRIPAEGMGRNAATALFSGPAAGVMGATRLAERSGFRSLITLDMGGTSTDICLVVDGQPALTAETEIDGLPVRTPVLDIVSVGAGGGSIIWADEGGMLRAGPQSAGAHPGPACYGHGGGAPTITDAHVIRGTIRPKAFLGGRMAIDEQAAASVFEPLAAQFKMSLAQIADAAIRVADANIVRATQIVSTERGHDPRDYVLVPFGGAGPLHAARIAEDLGIRTICVPPCAGVISAYGLLAADYTHHDSVTRRLALAPGVEATVRQVFAEMRERTRARFAEIGLSGEPKLGFLADMRFVGQAFEVPVELPVDALDRLDAAEIAHRFEAAHEKIYSHGAHGRQRAEIVAFRLRASLPLAAIPPLEVPAVASDVEETAEIVERGETLRCLVIARGARKPGSTIEGPALLEDATSTIYVPKGWTGAIDAAHDLILRKA
jgi:N-methylhydantoinase A